MKKLILILALCSAQLFAFDEQAYRRLMNLETNHELADFIGADLEGAVIQNIDLTNVNFTGANLRNAQFRNVLLRSVNFDNTSLNGSIISNTAFINCEIKNHSSFNYATLDGVTFEHSGPIDSSFDFATIRNTDFLGSNIRNTSMNNITAGFKICFIGSTLENVRFIQSKIQGLIICGAEEIGRGLNFEASQICQGLFLGNVTQSFLRESKFAGALLEGCFLLNIKFENSENIRKMAAGIKSIFKNVTFTDSEEMAALISKGAKINGKYDGAYKDDWSNESDFLAQLITTLGWGFVSGIAQGSGRALAIKLAALVPAPPGCSVQ